LKRVKTLAKKSFDCIVIGAGLAGLSAAKELQNRGLSILVIEADERPGGRVKSDLINGFTLDHGFQVINIKYPAVKKSGILKDLKFTPIVKGLFPFKIIGKPKTIKGIFNSFLTGVFLTEPQKISKKVKRKIYQSLIFGKPGLFDGGASAFSETLAKNIENINFQEHVISISNGTVTTNKENYQTKAIIIATDPSSANKLIGNPIPIPMNSSTTWYHSTKIPLKTKGKFAINLYGSVINSFSISDRVPSYAPPGKQLFSTTTLSKLNELEVRQELSKIWSCEEENWELVGKYEIEESLPLHPPKKPLFSTPKIQSGIYVAGDYWGYPSQQGAMESGIRAVKALIADNLIH
jgi:hypothetical protein